MHITGAALHIAGLFEGFRGLGFRVIRISQERFGIFRRGLTQFPLECFLGFFQ